MKLTRRGALGLVTAALVAAGGGAALAAHAANPPAPITAVTHIQNDPDSGNGGTWADDQITRTLTVTLDSPQPNGTPAGALAYTATISDTGTFTTRPGAFTPNQVVPGQTIANVVSGTLTGSATYSVVAPAADVPDASNVLPALNDGGVAATGDRTTGDWPAQAFPVPGSADVTLGAWSWTYTTAAGETWTDASTNGYGDLLHDGNITGLLAPAPVIIALSHGQATATTPNHETVSFDQSGAASWDEFYIVGPGAINGHKGWIYGKLGTNFGFYTGLKAHHGYTVYYTPVEGRGSNVQVPGSHSGYVYFVS